LTEDAFLACLLDKRRHCLPISSRDEFFLSAGRGGKGEEEVVLEEAGVR
jgi:hypothetical protein